MKKFKFILFIVLNDVKKIKNIKKKLTELKVDKFIVIDTVGSTEAENYGMKYSSMMVDTISNHDSSKYNKTIFVALRSEEQVMTVMDELTDIMELETDKPGKGIMFTVPIYNSQLINL